ncbi:SRPBCC family protein [Caldimonas sp. KR1-144]|uniref:SRPBCC family protein n=1 Tax=Caldimonas sp. KR1-144 TaxID=3400911 RepID=UPI003C12284B
MLKFIALAVVAALAAVLIAAATRPDTFVVQRKTHIAAAPDKVFAQINDLQRFNAWNPFNKKDPAVQGRYSGPAAGPGATYEFAGNKDVGRGRLAIAQSTPSSSVQMKLDMLDPFEAHNDVHFTLAPAAGGTEVTWAMQGPLPYVAKIAHLFFDMDRMVGRDFEAGLADLKAQAERS